jgi:hypothetical protein
VKYADDLHAVRFHPIDHDIRQAGHDEFPHSWEMAGAPNAREIPQAINRGLNPANNIGRGFRLRS